MTFTEALAYFADGSVDLLHIDGFHTYEAVKEDYRRWLPKLSNRAVVLFHDINVRASDFGVWRLWDEISSSHPSFEFFHCHGLGVLPMGNEVPDAIASLCQPATLIDTSRVRDRFAALGHLHVLEYKSVVAIDRLRVEAGIAQQEIKREAQRESEVREHNLAEVAANFQAPA